MSDKTTGLVKLQCRLRDRIQDWNGYKQIPCFKSGDIENEKLIIKNTGGHGDQNN